MFNQQTNELNDFTPSWLKLPPTRERRPQTLHWLHNNNADSFQSRKADSVLQKDDFPCLVEVSSDQHRGGGTSAWSAPLAPLASSPSPSPTPPGTGPGSAPGSIVGQLGSRGGNRMYKAMLPRNLTRRVLAPRPTNVEPQPQQVPAEFEAGVNNNGNKADEAKNYDALKSRSPATIMTSATSTVDDCSASNLATTTPTTANFTTTASLPPVLTTTMKIPTPPPSTVARGETTTPLTRSSDVISIKQANQQQTEQLCHGNDIYNQNLFPPASPCCDEAEERLLRAMGWRREEVAGEGPLTPEEITEATHWGHHIGANHPAANPLHARQLKLQHQQLQQQQQMKQEDSLRDISSRATLQQLKKQLQYPATDRINGNLNINIQRQHERDLVTVTGRGVQLEHAQRMGSDLKRALLATMGVIADSDSDLEDDNEDSDDDDG